MLVTRICDLRYLFVYHIYFLIVSKFKNPNIIVVLLYLYIQVTTGYMYYTQYTLLFAGESICI